MNGAFVKGGAEATPEGYNYHTLKLERSTPALRSGVAAGPPFCLFCQCLLQIF